jgi:nucleotide-binding universal stress UspA family protein
MALGSPAARDESGVSTEERMMTQTEAQPVHDVVVVGVDGSEPSKNALLWGLFIARATHTHVEAVIAWHPFVAMGWQGMGGSVVGNFDPQSTARQVLDATVDSVFGTGRPADLKLTVTEGVPAAVLLKASAGARMLVVGSRGHGGFAGLLLGSVSGASAEHATCPVLVIHGETPAPIAV